MKPLISIIMNCYNGEKFLRETIDSVLAQTYKNWEIIFWDNQSTDESAKIFNSYCDPRFHYFYSKKHTFLGEARDLAVEKTQGDWIAFLDCDDIWSPEKLEKQAEVIKKENESNNDKGKKPLGIVYCRSGVINNNTISFQQPGSYTHAPLPEGNVLTELLYVENFMFLLSVLVSKKAYRAIGGIPKHYTQAEDYYLFAGVASQYRLRALQEVYCFYRIHENNMSHRQKVVTYEESLMVFKQWEHFTKVSSKERIKRARKLCTYAGLMLVIEDKKFITGIVRILKQGDIFFGIILILKHLFKKFRKDEMAQSYDNEKIPSSIKDISQREEHPSSFKDISQREEHPLKENMKILMIIPTVQLGGMERVASILSVEWAKNHDVSVCVFDAENQAFPVGGQLFNLSIPGHTSIWIKILGMFKKISRLSSILKEIKPDYIITFCVSATLPSMLACILSGCTDKLSISFHTSLDLVPKKHKLAMAFLYRIPNRLLTPSVAARLQLINQLHLPANKCQVVLNPLDLDLISKQKTAPLPKEYEDIGPIILAAGHLLPVKGFDRLIETFAIVGQTFPGKLVILGDGYERKRLESKIVELDLSSRVLMPGGVENPFAWMSKADAYVLSSHSEGWGMVILEAFACKCPVISFDCDTGPREIIKDRKNGLLADTGDITELANAITEVLNNSNLRNQLITNGIVYAKNCSVANVAPLWLAEPSVEAWVN